MFVIFWKFKPRAGYEAEFESAYGPHGVWTDLFSRVNGYLGSSLLKEVEGEDIYIAVDRWDSKETFKSFMDRYKTDYDTIDRHFEDITDYEIKIGEFITY